MYTSVIAIVSLALAAVSNAVPTYGSEPASSVTCGNGQVISCCNSADSSTEVTGAALVGTLGLNKLLGGNCSPLDVNVLGVQVPINQACAGNQAACCTGNQNGLVNIQCTPINV